MIFTVSPVALILIAFSILVPRPPVRHSSTPRAPTTRIFDQPHFIKPKLGQVYLLGQVFQAITDQHVQCIYKVTTFFFGDHAIFQHILDTLLNDISREGRRRCKSRFECG